MNIDELIDQLRTLLRTQGCIIASTWCIDDVKALRPDLTNDQCIEVLAQCERKHDAEVGIDWDVIRCHADMLFPKARLP